MRRDVNTVGGEKVAEPKKPARSVFRKYLVEPVKKAGKYAALPVLLTLAGCAAKNADVKNAKEISTQNQEETEPLYSSMEISKIEWKIGRDADEPTPINSTIDGTTSPLSDGFTKKKQKEEKKHVLPKLKEYEIKPARAHALIACEFEKGKCIKKAYEGDSLIETEPEGPFEAAGVRVIIIKKVDENGVELDIRLDKNPDKPILLELSYGELKGIWGKLGYCQPLMLSVEKGSKSGGVGITIEQPISLRYLVATKKSDVNQHIKYKKEKGITIAEHVKIQRKMGEGVISLTTNVNATLEIPYSKKDASAFLRIMEKMISQVGSKKEIKTAHFNVKLDRLASSYKNSMDKELKYATLLVDRTSESTIRYIIIPAETLNDAKKLNIESSVLMAVIDYEMGNENESGKIKNNPTGIYMDEIGGELSYTLQEWNIRVLSESDMLMELGLSSKKINSLFKELPMEYEDEEYKEVAPLLEPIKPKDKK